MENFLFYTKIKYFLIITIALKIYKIIQYIEEIYVFKRIIKLKILELNLNFY